MTVTKIDHRAAADWLTEEGLDWNYCGDVRKGIEDHALSDAFAKHREDAERPLLERIEALEAALESISAYSTGWASTDPATVMGAIARQALGETQ
jgi:hypothetical protein